MLKHQREMFLTSCMLSLPNECKRNYVAVLFGPSVCHPTAHMLPTGGCFSAFTQELVVGKLDIHMQNNGTLHLHHTQMHKNQLKME